MARICPIHKRPLISYCPSCRAQKAGSTTSKRKAAAAKRNALKGGRPRKYTRCRRYRSHRFSPQTGRCPCGYERPEA